MKRHFCNRVIGLAAGTVVFGAISACGGAGGGGVDVADGGIRGTGSSVGPVSGFGSVFINGVEFSTDDIPNREVESNDGITAEVLLSEGMILRVEGEWRDDGTGTADRLSYDDTLRGRVDLVEPDPSGAGEFVTLSIMGQSVRVDRQTVVRGTTFATLLGGSPISDHIRVSAWRQADGSYRAGYIQVIDPDPTNIELEGSVLTVDTNLNEFTIGTITVQYDEDDVSFGSGLTETDLATATALEVEGTLAGNLLTAATIDRDDARRFSRSSADDIEFTATIDSSYTSSGAVGTRPGEFTMGSLTVRVTDATELDDSISLVDLAEGLLIQVEGKFLSDTVVEAEEIELRDGNAKVKGVISSAADNTIIIGGVEVLVSPTTTFTVEDGSGISFQALPISSTTVEVEGVERGQDADIFIEALKVEVDDEIADFDDRDLYELEGRLTNITPASITILGVAIDAGPEAYDSNSQGEIINLFDDGELLILEVEYSGSTNNFIADEIDLEENDDD
ncbi:hypothetical protein SAMN04487881_1300 [Marinobacter sp. es.048]|uniref:DUF5666 domain-containing protein n=1 Tax=Marinobacter sp. es.048 TaxID=1761795 RepID=UPI000B58C5EA|nr:DUF5666 domain-containing protein [Marinobacter sp. es.048]SNC65517.1 hypothetical protein SAMN04487881_1300 [Marinobacter sp. es.048]